MTDCIKEARKIIIHEEINQKSMEHVIKELLDFLDEDQEKENKEKDFERNPIKLYINSYGGYVDDMWALVDIMLNSKTPIYTYCTSYAHSCGFMIFIAGQKRFITKHTNMCCHQFSGGVFGTYQDMKERMEIMDRLWRDFVEYICTRTNITKQRLEEIKDRKLDWYIFSEESIGLGIATDFVDEF